jgi:vitamin B12/bleomycin/antimicrobial peptide transport system ATP-binding/permease protein
LPQRPYCTLGSLRDQLLYPAIAEIVTAELENFQANGHQDKEKANGQTVVPGLSSHRLKQHLSDEDLIEILQKVDLLDVAVRAGKGDPTRGLVAVLDWSNMLSLGEQQRLAFGRLLVHRPRLVILDEATSALDMLAEARMYTLLQTGGFTYVSVGHRPSLLAYHDKRLRLVGGDAHELTDIEKESFQTAVAEQIRNL